MCIYPTLSLLVAVQLFTVATTTWSSSFDSMSPAEQKIARAKQVLAANPKSYVAHNQLAMSLTKRARETHHPDYYARAAVAVEKSLELEPNNLAARKIQCWILLGQHEFDAALEAAKALVQRNPDDVVVYGLLTDAHVELGNYEEAERAAQWMLDLRPGNVAGLTRAAYLRELFGDAEGAIDLMQMAVNRVPPYEVEERAWILSQIAKLYLQSGRLEIAEEHLESALELFPDYHYALAAMGETCAAKGEHDLALTFFQKHYDVAPHPENLYLLGKALQRVGRKQKALDAFRQFEEVAREEMNGADNANRELIFYYAEEGNEPAEALRIASSEIQRRKDVFTLEACAWAYYVNDQPSLARTHMVKALEIGIQDARLWYHAGAIVEKEGDLAGARSYYEKIVRLNPASEWGEKAQAALYRLEASPVQG